MGWEEFQAYVWAMNHEQTQASEDEVGSWKGTENDPWWQAARRERAEMQGH